MPERERLEDLWCIDDCAKKRGTYELPGRCENCLADFTLILPKSHPAPYRLRCAHCECDRVTVDYSVLRAARAGSPQGGQDGA